MTVDAAMLCCCGGDGGGAPSFCCTRTSVTMTVSGTLDFDFTFDTIDLFGQAVTLRRFTWNGTVVGGVYQQGPLTLSSDFQQPIILQRFPAYTSDNLGFGSTTLGRCGYREERAVAGSSNYSGWDGRIITIPVGISPTFFNIAQFGSEWHGRAIASNSNSGKIVYYLRPFTVQEYGQPIDTLNGPYAFEAGVACGNIVAGLRRMMPSSSCPTGGVYMPGDYNHQQNYNRGRIRRQQYLSYAVSTWGSDPLTENQTLQQVLLTRAGYAQPSSLIITVQ